ncbi:sensor histidine kinase [Streptomyces noursei]|uniref:sensor histidine kinase n=1 Tax=Streptomyces noursei TaxID=1971 RepID=UPI000C9B2392|nr:histidine kinase [Streptomyces noursei]
MQEIKGGALPSDSVTAAAPASPRLVRVRWPSVLEAVIAAGLVLLWLAGGIGGPMDWPLLAVSAASVLLFGRGAPLVAAGVLLAVACGLFLAFGWFGQPLAAVTVAAAGMFLLGTALARVRGLAAAIVLLVALSAAYTYAHRAQAHPLAEDGTTLLVTALAYTLPAAAGRSLRYRELARATAQQRAAALEGEREAVELRVRLEERSQIAREMHDVIGHRVGNMVALAGGLQAAGAPARPELAERAGMIAAEGRSALLELRVVLGLLTSPEVGGAPALGAGAHGLETLVRSTGQAGGMPVALTVDGHLDVLPDAVQRAVYRIVREGMTNTVKHAPGATVAVMVACTRRGVEVEVTNGRAIRSKPAGLPVGGSGLTGARERATALGGTLTTTVLPDGGFRLSASLPTAPAVPLPVPPGGPVASSPGGEPAAPTPKDNQR